MNQPSRTFSPSFGLSIASIVVALLFGMNSIASLLSTAAMASTSAGVTSHVEDGMLKNHRDLMAMYQQQLKVRAPFGKPVPKPPTSIKLIPATTQPQAAASVILDDRYTGPSLIALVGAKAWFKPAVAGEGVMRLSIGQEHAGVTLLGIDGPWTATVHHRGRNHTLTLFDEHRTDAYFRATSLTDLPSTQKRRSQFAIEDGDPFGDRRESP